MGFRVTGFGFRGFLFEGVAGREVRRASGDAAATDSGKATASKAMLRVGCVWVCLSVSVSVCVVFLGAEAGWRIGFRGFGLRFKILGCSGGKGGETVHAHFRGIGIGLVKQLDMFSREPRCVRSFYATNCVEHKLKALRM